MIDQFFNWCVWALVAIGNITGMGYELANIVIFVIIQPALILLFFFYGEEKKERTEVSLSNDLHILQLTKRPETRGRIESTTLSSIVIP